MRSPLRVMLAFILLALLTVAQTVALAMAQSPGGAATPGAPWTVDDLIRMERAGGFRISPDGQWAVWVKNVPHMSKNERVSQLMLTSLTEDREFQLTRGADSAQQPRWSPDGRHIAFLTTRQPPEPADQPRPAPPGADEDPKAQLWVIRASGGEPWPLTELDRPVSHHGWADAETVIFAAQESPTLYERRIKEAKDTTRVVDDEENEPPVRLFEVKLRPAKLGDRRLVRLTTNADRIAWFELSPDGKRAVAQHERSLRYVYDGLKPPVTFLHDLAAGTSRQIFTGKVHKSIDGAWWTQDGSGFYAASRFSSHPIYAYASILELYHYDLASGSERKVDLGWPRGLAGDSWYGDAGFAVTRDGFLALLADGARHRLARYTRQGDSWQRQGIEGEHAANIFGFAAARDGRTLVYRYTTASRPPQYFRAALEGSRLSRPVQITKLNPHLEGKALVRTEIIRWKGARGAEIEGILYFPLDYEKGKRYPLITAPHGGPASVDFDEFGDGISYPYNLLAQRGAFVLLPNYHGSSNYGLEFVEAIGGGNYLDLELPDMETGMDHLIAQGMADPGKLAVGGWSNGAILSTMLAVRQPRYKALVAGAGDVEWVGDWGNAHFGAAFDNFYFGASPLENPEIYKERSAFYKLDRVTAPTLIFFGTEDTNVPTSQGWLHYRAMQQLGKTPVRFLLFPGEKHSLAKITHQRRKVEEELAWLDQYLFETKQETNPALKQGSPLDVALKLQQGSRDGRRFGVLHNRRLIPETVQHEGLEVGRFEVTRDQFAAFDGGYKVEPGTENLPASGITFAQAQAYVAWLSRHTGQSYRLPTEAEAEKLYASAEEAENTFDYWAGYSVNPDDAARLAPKLQKLGGAAAMLREVGSFPGRGKDAPVFDLGGNVAEWVVAADGTGKAMGGSADTPADSRLRTRQPAPEFIGLRVVKAPAAK